MDVIISPSILGYESCLKESMEKIRKILSLGIEWLHLDIMRRPFIPSRETFSEESISMLYGEFGDKAAFDFHLMVSNPDPLIETIDRKIPGSLKSKDAITIHREAYRDDWGEYGSKDLDLYSAMSKDPQLSSKLREMDGLSCERVCKTLKNIRDLGYGAGLALEPGTSFLTISDDMVEQMDMLLLMGVRSGEGGQEYMPEVTGKIKGARNRYRGRMIQVDGGVNEKTIPEIIGGGANNLVIGSYITNAEDLTERINQIRTYIKGR